MTKTKSHANPKADKRKAQAWPEPQPLKGEMRPVQKLREEMIPKPFRDWLVDMAHRMQCPLDFVATPAICAASGVIGAGCTIRPKELDDWAVVPNLWGGVIGRPGTKKSPAINEAFKPLRRLEKLAKEKFEAKKGAHEADLVAFEARRKAIRAEIEKAAKDGAEVEHLKLEYATLLSPAAPSRKRYITSDTTIEKASEIMKENPRGLIIERDELIGFLASLDREDRKQDRSFHLSGWNGYGGFTADRIGRGTIDTPQLCETIFGGIQPSKLNGYLALTKNDIANDGLLQRFQLLNFPDDREEPVIIDELPDINARGQVFQIFETLAEMDFTVHGAEADEHTKITYFHLAPEAQGFFNKWLLKLERRLLLDDENVMIEHLAKYRSLMPSLALVFHLIERADWIVCPRQPLSRFGEPDRKVSLGHAELAAQWCDYLETHALRIYGLAVNAPIQAAKKLLEKIRAGLIEDGFNARDVYSQNWALLDSKESAQSAINELLDLGWLREFSWSNLPTGGRPLAPTYRIHPKAKGIL